MNTYRDEEERKRTREACEGKCQESREHKTYQRFYGSHEEVLLASGDHNSLSIQGPVQNSLAEENYDFTIGKMR